MPNISVKGDTRMQIEITDWRFLIKELKKVEPKVVSRFRREAKVIAKPVENAIKKAIPNTIDIKGMKPKVVPGRTTWGAVVSARKTTLKINPKMYKRTGTSIVSVWAWSPAVAILDMAKNAGRGDGKLTREYEYSLSPTGTRRHRVNGQGRGLLKAAGKSKKLQRADRPSRIVWPAAMTALPQVNVEMGKLIESEALKINVEMRRK